MAENTQDLANQSLPVTDDVLTLHHAVVARWGDERSVSRRTAAAFDASAGRHGDWISALNGLATLGGSFGPQAWNIASELASAPQLLQRLSPGMRSLQLGELADLVQIVLEEEEGGAELADLEEQAVSQASLRSGKTTATTAMAKARAAAGPTGGKKAAAAKKSPAVQTKLRELRRLLAQLRVDASQSATGVSVPQQAGIVGPNSPDAAIAEALAAGRSVADPARLGSAADAQRPAALAASAGDSIVGGSIAALMARANARSVANLRGSAATPARRGMALNPWAAVAQVQAELPSRALRMAEAAADMGFLNLAAEPDQAATPDFDAVSATSSTARAPSASRAAALGQGAAALGQGAAALGKGAAALGHGAGAQAAQTQNPAAKSGLARAGGSTPQAAIRLAAPLAQAGASESVSAASSTARAPSVGRVAALASSTKPTSATSIAAQVSAFAAAQQAWSGVAAAPVANRATAAGRVAAQASAPTTVAGGRATLALQGMVDLAHKTWLRGERAATTGQRSVAGLASLGDDGSLPVGVASARAVTNAGPASAWARWVDAAGRAYAGAPARSGHATAGSSFAPASSGSSADRRESALVGSSPDRQILELRQDVAAQDDVAGDDTAAMPLRSATDARGMSVPVQSQRAAAALPSWVAPHAARIARQHLENARVATAERTRLATAVAAKTSVGPFGALTGGDGVASGPGGAVRAPLGLGHVAGTVGAPKLATLGLPGLIGAVAAGVSARVAERSGFELSVADRGWAKPSVAAQAGPSVREAPGEWLDTSTDFAEFAADFVSPGVRTARAAAAESATVRLATSAAAQRGVASPQASSVPAGRTAPFSKSTQVGGATPFGAAAGESEVGRRSAGMGAAPAIAAAARTIDYLRGRVQSTWLADQAGQGVVSQVAGRGELGLLAVRPAGRADALSTWLSSKSVAAAQADRPDTAGELLSLANELELGDAASAEATVGSVAAARRAVDKAAAKSTSARSATQSERAPPANGASDRGAALAGVASGSVQTPAALAKRSLVDSARSSGTRLNRQAATAAAAPIASLGLQNPTPRALRAILEALGESVPGGASDVATAFAAKWLGRSDVARQVLAKATALAGRDAAVGDLLQTSDASEFEIGSTNNEFAPGEGPALRGSERRAPRTSAAATTASTPLAADLLANRKRDAVPATGDGNTMVLTGLAALAALSSGDLFGSKPAGRTMRTAETEQTLLQPAAEATQVQEATVDAGESSARVPAKPAQAAASRKLAAVKLHEFAPVGLARGRNLFGQQRRAAWQSRGSKGLHTTPKGNVHATIQSLTRMATARGERRFGYGAASLGGGELLGLTGASMGEGDVFFGEAAPATGVVRGADRLSQSVMGRRQGSSATTSAQRPMRLPDFDGAPVIPTNFSAGDAGATVHSMADAVAASGRRGGATASGQGAQAAAMTRVLSVTSSPTGNMLPLVAPAAQAVVAAAAAKPLSESIVTSGADPSLGVPIVGVGDHKAGKAGGEGGGQKARDGADEHAANVQDIEALAMKIARAVMVRIKRERERRGLHV